MSLADADSYRPDTGNKPTCGSFPAVRSAWDPRKVPKGGSRLCAPNYCRRYRPAARHAEPVDTSTSR
jgi:hypothetical protein